MTKKPRKRRYNISIANDIRKRGEKLAAKERRSFSGLIENLIQREFDRLNGGANVAQS